MKDRPAGPARRRAESALEDAIERFLGVGYSETNRRGPLEATVSGPGRLSLRLALVPVGRVFGGTYGLEIASQDALLPRTKGLSARGRGAVRLTGIAFRPARGDAHGAELASLLERDRLLQSAIANVHFERIRVEPDGRPVIRHMGGSVVWILFPPLVKRIPLVREQVAATVGALEAFSRAGA